MWQNWQAIRADISLKYFLPVSAWRLKPSFVVSDGLSPCIFDETVKDIKNCDAGYTSMFHEATTNGKTKQLDVITRYGSNERKQVVSK